MKYSHQRTKIYEAVRGSKLHPSADMVYQKLRKENPSLSLGTVYRNLNQLTEAGQLRKIPVDGGSDRFDGTLAPHYHAICSCCGRVVDIWLDDLQLSEQVHAACGFVVSGYELLIRGTCADCLKKAAPEQ